MAISIAANYRLSQNIIILVSKSGVQPFNALHYLFLSQTMVSVFAPLIAVRFSPQAFVFSLGRLLVFHVKVADTFSLFCFSFVVLLTLFCFSLVVILSCFFASRSLFFFPSFASRLSFFSSILVFGGFSSLGIKKNRERAVVNAAAPCWRYVKHKVEMSSTSVKMLSPLRLCFF